MTNVNKHEKPIKLPMQKTVENAPMIHSSACNKIMIALRKKKKKINNINYEHVYNVLSVFRKLKKTSL